VIFLYVALAVLGLLLVWAIVTYNGLVRSRNKVDEARSGIEVQLERRHDLVPNLVEIVKGYADHERELLGQVTRARIAAVASQGPVEVEHTEAELTAAIENVGALAESYPELRASEGFRRLQLALAEVENEIQAARRIYNGNVQDYNMRIGVFPDSLVAARLAFRERRFIQLDPAVERAVLQVA
jgi:LemA protein